MAALNDADSRGLDAHRALPHLVADRPLIGADDVAAVLHERVDSWVRARPLRRQRVPDRIVGLLPRTQAPADPNMHQALQDRQTHIECRTRELSEEAVRNAEPWMAPLGTPPADPVRRELWMRHVDAITAYREHWNIAGRDILGPPTPRSLEQNVHMVVAQQALDAARRLQHPDLPRHRQHQPSAYLRLGRGGPER